MKAKIDRTKAVDSSGLFPVSAFLAAGMDASEFRPRIALVTPYNGGNLGDAAIQDSMIANIRLRLPGTRFSGICLNLHNFLERHGTGAFPMCGMNRPFYHMLYGTVGNQPLNGMRLPTERRERGLKASLKAAVIDIQPLWRLLKGVRDCCRELRHWAEGYQFLRTHDLVIVSGGGQLNEEWGGAWGQPFALFKWAVLARFARVPYVIASVGVGKIESKTARFMMTATLRMASYRSYREKNTRVFAGSLLPLAANDPVVPDHVLAMPPSELPRASGIRNLAQGRPIIAISPIAYAKPQKWPSEDRTTYERYMLQMARVMSDLLDRGYFLIIVCSSLWDDECAIADLLGHLDERSKTLLSERTHTPAISTWRDLVGSLLDVDFLIASRLHSVILGLVAQTPTIAISFEPKVEWVMDDLDQTDYLVRIRDFVAEDVIAALDRISVHRNEVKEQIAFRRREILSACAPQYDALADFALASGRQPASEHRMPEELTS